MQCTTGVAVPAGPDRLGGPWSRGPKGTAATSRGHRIQQGSGRRRGRTQLCSALQLHPPFTSSVGVGRGGLRDKPLRNGESQQLLLEGVGSAVGSGGEGRKEGAFLTRKVT